MNDDIRALNHEGVKVIDTACAFRIDKTGNDKLASGIPEEDKAYYDKLIAQGNASKKHPKDEVVLVLAATPWEYFGPNDNGDALFSAPFARVSAQGTLPVTYKSFTERAIASRNHQYKDKDLAIGEILNAYYNPKYKRLEVLIRYDWAKATRECRKIAGNKCLLVSMGYRIYAPDLPAESGEFCSVCGHHNRRPMDRCEHLSSMIGSVVDGVPVYMMNGIGYFVDISSVAIPGDFNARVILRGSSDSSEDSIPKAKSTTDQFYSDLKAVLADRKN